MHGASIIKTSLRGAKPVNQDAIRVYSDGALIGLCVADGLGSSPHSEVGSRLACQSFMDCVRKSRKHGLPLVFSDISNKWKALVTNKGFSTDECLTTCSFVLVDTVTNRILEAHVGDSGTILCIDGTVCDLREEKDFLNETQPLGRAPFKVSRWKYEKDFCILMASDGISDELDTEKLPELLDYFREKYETIASNRRNILFSSEIRGSLSKKNNDDKSVICVWKS